MVKGTAEEDNVLINCNHYHQRPKSTNGWPRSVVTLLKACAKEKDLGRGSKLHADILKTPLLEQDVFVGSALVNMYAKCGALSKAQEVFDELPLRDAVSWTVLIAGYAQHGNAEEALKCAGRMQLEGLSPNAVTFSCILKACGSLGFLDKGQEIHAEILRHGLLEKNVVLGTALVDMYAKCGALAKAHNIFDELPDLDTVSWNALIAGYAQHERGEEAINCFTQMQLEGFSPNERTFSCVLRACGSIRATDKGQEIHIKVVREGLLEKNEIIGNALVDMYAKCGAVAKAQEVFDELPVRDVVSWNSLIAGYAEHGLGMEAVTCFEQMQLGGQSPDAVTMTCVLKACGILGAVGKGQEIHGEIVRHELLEKDHVLGIALVDMYAKCGALAQAQEVFDELPVQSTVLWNALLAGYAEHGHSEEAFYCFEQMQRTNFSPTAATYVSILKACARTGASDKGQELHAEVVRQGLLDNDNVVGNALLDMYVKCGKLAKAQEVFKELPVQNAVSWTVLISGYTQHGHGKEAINCFEQMQHCGQSPDAVTFACVLKACGSVGAADKGEVVHREIVRQGLLENDIVVGTALVDMYAKCGAVTKAQEVFNELPVRNLVTWNALLAGFSQHGHGEEAISCFEQMQLSGVSPNAITFACILNACGSVGALDKGQEIHTEIARQGLLEKELIVGNALVDMYVKCGALAKAQEVFDELPARDAISWNALIAGHAQLGNDSVVLDSLNKMIEEGEGPGQVTFIILLSTCSHLGELDKALFYFESMSTSYGLIPALEHHICMVDLFGRAGHLDKVIAMIKEMPFSVDPTVWHTLLGACQKWGNVELARSAFKHAVELDEKDAATYVCMSNVYAAAGMQKDAEAIQAIRVKEEGRKESG